VLRSNYKGWLVAQQLGDQGVVAMNVQQCQRKYAQSVLSCGSKLVKPCQNKNHTRYIWVQQNQNVNTTKKLQLSTELLLKSLSRKSFEGDGKKWKEWLDHAVKKRIHSKYYRVKTTGTSTRKYMESWKASTTPAAPAAALMINAINNTTW